MEEAYRELYQQFLQLRSLCLRQAALLHQLTTAQHKQQGAAHPNGEIITEAMSVPVQCALEFPVLFAEKPHPLTMAAHNPAAQRATGRCSRDVAPDPLAADMSGLCMDPPLQSKEDGEVQMKAVAPLLTLDPSWWQGAGKSGGSKGAVRIPAPQCPTKVMDYLSQPGSVLMSELMMQSHVCDFCQAVFPGDSTTKGEFLQHLHMHIT